MTYSKEVLYNIKKMYEQLTIHNETKKNGEEAVFSAYNIIGGYTETVLFLLNHDLNSITSYKGGICLKDSNNKNCLEEECRNASGYLSESPLGESGVKIFREAWKDEREKYGDTIKIFFKL